MNEPNFNSKSQFYFESVSNSSSLQSNTHLKAEKSLKIKTELRSTEFSRIIQSILNNYLSERESLRETCFDIKINKSTSTFNITTHKAYHFITGNYLSNKSVAYPNAPVDAFFTKGTKKSKPILFFNDGYNLYKVSSQGIDLFYSNERGQRNFI